MNTLVAEYVLLEKQYALLKSIQNSKLLNADLKKNMKQRLLARLLRDANSFGTISKGTGQCKRSLANTFERKKADRKKTKK